MSERVMIIDGAMGTSVQAYKLKEEDFRAERYKDHENDLKGNNDILVLTRPDVIKEIHSGVFGGWCGYHRNEHVQRDYDFSSGLRFGQETRCLGYQRRGSEVG